MKPAALSARDFSRYSPAARQFAVEHLGLLRQLPIAICPSFLDQIVQLGTSFPAEETTLRWQCDSLFRLPPDRLQALTQPFKEILVRPALERSDWVNAPAVFIAQLSSNLWSDGQIDRFRTASDALFMAIPPREDTAARLTVVVFGQDAQPHPTATFSKLTRNGVLLTNLQTEQMPQQIFETFSRHAAGSEEKYSHWYVDGGEPWKADWRSIPGTVTVSYPELNPVRVRTLHALNSVVQSGGGGAEQMRTDLVSLAPGELDIHAVTPDPVLQRFYTELFTRSSGPQVFSTTFVQWTGRELARRAQPHTMLLRYAPRQQYQYFNDLLREAKPHSLDPEGSLRDAEMGAYYSWIEMSRITARGKGSFIAWLEGSSQAVVIGSNAPAGTQCNSALRLQQTLDSFC